MTQLRLDGSTEPEGLGDENDFWETPPWVVEALVTHLPERGMPWHVYDPGCGRGALVTAIAPHIEIASATGIDVHEQRVTECNTHWRKLSIARRVIRGDFLEAGSYELDFREPSAVQLFLMNPPYSKPRKTIGREFVLRALELAAPHGVVAALLPLAFCETPGRKELIHDRYKSRLRVFADRPGFGGEHDTGSLAYAWFIWDLLNPKDDWAAI